MRYKLDPLKLDKLQKAHNLTNSALADKAGCATNTIQNVRNGRSCSMITALRIAEALGVPVEVITKTEPEREGE